jgi:hypothetical protein
MLSPRVLQVHNACVFGNYQLENLAMVRPHDSKVEPQTGGMSQWAAHHSTESCAAVRRGGAITAQPVVAGDGALVGQACDPRLSGGPGASW